MRSALRQKITSLVDMYADLCRVNRRIGIWDMRRHAVCKQDLADIDTAYLVKTERLGRIHVERRAELKSQIDLLFAEIAASRTSANEEA